MFIKIYTVILWLMIISLFVFNPNAKGDEIHDITAIIYAEHSNPKATKALLNTYYSTGNHDQSLLEKIKENSCAYRFKSIQYTKAKSLKLNKYERQRYKKIYNQVKKFKPKKDWLYIKHESITFYKDQPEMIATLKKKWGNQVDYNRYIIIEKEYFFAKKG